MVSAPPHNLSISMLMLMIPAGSSSTSHSVDTCSRHSSPLVVVTSCNLHNCSVEPHPHGLTSYPHYATYASSLASALASIFSSIWVWPAVEAAWRAIDCIQYTGCYIYCCCRTSAYPRRIMPSRPRSSSPRPGRTSSSPARRPDCPGRPGSAREYSWGRCRGCASCPSSRAPQPAR